MTDCLISYCRLLLLCTQFASTLDLLPTIFNLVGATIPNDHVTDGYDMALILFKRGQVCDFTQSYIATRTLQMPQNSMGAIFYSNFYMYP